MRAVLDRSALERLRDAALARHERGRLDAVGRDPGASSLTGPDWTWVRSSQSITLGPLLDDALQLLMASAFGNLVRQRFEQPLCIASQAWIRRQHPPAHRPPRATPHSWHQDGALGFDFLSPPAQPRLLPLLACWIPLDPCGRDAASLEIVDANLNELLLLNRLTDENDEAFSAGPCRAIEAQPADLANASADRAKDAQGDASLELLATARRVKIGGRWAMRESDHTVDGTLQGRTATLGPGVVVDASRKVKIEGRWAARVGDHTAHSEAEGVSEDEHEAVIAGPGVAHVFIG